MVVAVRCPAPACRKYMLVEEADQGKVVPCLICKTPIKVPAAAGASPPPPPPAPFAPPVSLDPVPKPAPADDVFLLPDPVSTADEEPFLLPDPDPPTTAPANVPVARLVPPRNPPTAP